MQKQPITDRELVADFLAGNGRAMETLVLRHKNQVYVSIYMMVKDRPLAEDLLHDTFIKAMEKIKSGVYKERDYFKAWILRLAHNMCMDHFRALKKMPMINHSKYDKDGEIDEHEIFDRLYMPKESACDEKYLKFETAIALSRLIDDLPAEQRDVIVMRHYFKMKFSEIAFIMDANVNTTLGRMRYGLLALREMITVKKLEL